MRVCTPAMTAFSLHRSFSSPLSSSSSSCLSTTDLISLYDGFILDQFGVLHDGKRPLPGAVDLVRHLCSVGKKLVVLSNTSSPSDAALKKLSALGFDPNHFVGAITSGEEASRYVRETYGNHGGGGGGGDEDDDDGGDRKKKRALWFTWDFDASSSHDPAEFLYRCGGVELARSTDDADFVLAHGSQILRGPGRAISSDAAAESTTITTTIASLGSFMRDGDLSVVDTILRSCFERKLPMVCANPDLVVRMPDGSLAHMPGKIARRYEEMGGNVVSFGKPHRSHFEACLSALRDVGKNGDGEVVEDEGEERLGGGSGHRYRRVAHVGDSLHHDVAGAIGAGVDSVFVTGGIHHDELMTMSSSYSTSMSSTSEVGTMPDEAALKALFEREGVYPTHVVPMFRT